MDKQEFIEWYLRSFSVSDIQIISTTISNMIDYAEDHFVTRDQAAWFLHDILEEVSFADICAFCDDSELTKDGLEQKRLGRFLHTQLQDGSGETGGIAYIGEMLEDFLYEQDGYICMEGVTEEAVEQINERLVSCGIKPVSFAF